MNATVFSTDTVTTNPPVFYSDESSRDELRRRRYNVRRHLDDYYDIFDGIESESDRKSRIDSEIRDMIGRPVMVGESRPVGFSIFHQFDPIAQEHRAIKWINAHVQQVKTSGLEFDTDFIASKAVADDLNAHIFTCHFTDRTLWLGDGQEIQYRENGDDRPNGRNTETIQVCNGYLSENLSQCECCDEYVPTDQINHSSNMCDYCHAENHTTCEDCSEEIHNDDAYSDDADTLCRRCFESREESRREDDEDNSYYQPSMHPQFTDFTRDNRTPTSYPTAFGLEIESEYEDDLYEDRFEASEALITAANASIHTYARQHRNDLNEQLSFVTSDRDGSLSARNGIEYGFLPLRLETLRHLFTDPDFCEVYRDYFDVVVMRHKKAVGLHISVSATCLRKGRPRYLAACIFRHLDSAEGEKAAYATIGRQPSAYGTNTALKPSYVAKAETGKSGSVAIRAEARPRATTRREQEGRIEFRAPRSHYKPGRILERVEFIAALIKWANSPVESAYTKTPAELWTDFETYRQMTQSDKKTANATN